MSAGARLAVAGALMLWLALIQRPVRAQPGPGEQDEATRLLQQYVRLDTSNPPGDTRQTADFLAGILEREGIPPTRYESAPGKAIIYGRLKATVTPPSGKAIVLLHHMDVVPADRSQWKLDPFAATITHGDRGTASTGVPGVDDTVLWGRGAMDMKGMGVSEILAFLRLKREHVPLSRDVVLLAEPDEEVGGAMGARWMIANHWTELDPEYVIDEGGFGSRDLFAADKLVYGISVAEKKLVWLKVRAEGVSGHGSQPHDQNPNDRLMRALGRLLATNPAPTPSASGATRRAQPDAQPSIVDVMTTHVGTLAANKFTNAIQHSTVALTWLRSGTGDPPKINVIPSAAEAGLDCRVLPGVTRDAWMNDIRRRLGDPSLKLELVNESDDPVVTPWDTSLYRHLEGAIRRLHPEAVVTPILIPYGTDSNAFRPKGVKSYGVFPAILSADTVASMHGDAERVPLSGVREAAQVFFEAIVETMKR
ncbi:MAG TPA: M20/M25/M40 family metallo-hydrolase [Vicinamibacterales bacterium]|nr:M20/M25/M40 family metallo-hydrolase [Vicinamibacterales bacterium]